MNRPLFVPTNRELKRNCKKIVWEAIDEIFKHKNGEIDLKIWVDDGVELYITIDEAKKGDCFMYNRGGKLCAEK